MCLKRKTLLVSQLAKLTANSNKIRRSSGTSGFGNNLSTSSQQPYTPELKSAKSTSQLDNASTLEEYNSSSPGTSLRSGSSTLSLDGSGGHGSKNRGPGTDADWEVKKVKRGHVLNELLQTERTYVEEIGEILAVRAINLFKMHGTVVDKIAY